jgi:hypothetical protein
MSTIYTFILTTIEHSITMTKEKLELKQYKVTIYIV